MSGVLLQLDLPRLNVTLDLPGQGICAITGVSGAGKTTLLRAVAGLEPQLRGRVVINDQIWHDDVAGIHVPVHRRALGYVFQEPSLFAHLSVRKNIEFGLRRSAAVDGRAALERAVQLLGIAALSDRMPALLSGGERQRVAIARALASSPAILLMDEPLASLDQQRKDEILPFLDQLQRASKIPVLYVSHATDEVARLADHVVVLEQGRVQASGTVFELINRAAIWPGSAEGGCTLIAAQVLAHDPAYQLTQVGFPGGALWLCASALVVGTTLRLRIQARDVSLSLSRPTDSSIVNSLPVTIAELREDGSGQTTVELQAGPTLLRARITRKSAVLLGLRAGMTVFAQIKGVAILR